MIRFNSYSMKFALLHLLFAFCFLTISAISFAAVLSVPSQYSKIQEAIDFSKDGDEIIVSEGIYIENIKFNGKNIILRSEDSLSTTIVANTIIDGGKAGSVVTFSGTELTTCVLEGFTIKNGLGSYGYGDGVSSYGGGVLGKRTKATIRNNTITENSADNFGGGIYGCAGTIANNNISWNFAKQGGGVGNCDRVIMNNIIKNNFVNNGG